MVTVYLGREICCMVNAIWSRQQAYAGTEIKPLGDRGDAWSNRSPAQRSMTQRPRAKMRRLCCSLQGGLMTAGQWCVVRGRGEQQQGRRVRCTTKVHVLCAHVLSPAYAFCELARRMPCVSTCRDVLRVTADLSFTREGGNGRRLFPADMSWGNLRAF